MRTQKRSTTLRQDKHHAFYLRKKSHRLPSPFVLWNTHTQQKMQSANCSHGMRSVISGEFNACDIFWQTLGYIYTHTVLLVRWKRQVKVLNVTHCACVRGRTRESAHCSGFACVCVWGQNARLRAHAPRQPCLGGSFPMASNAWQVRNRNEKSIFGLAAAAAMRPGAVVDFGL